MRVVRIAFRIYTPRGCSNPGPGLHFATHPPESLMTRCRRALVAIAPLLLAVPVAAWLALRPSACELQAAPPTPAPANDVFADSIRPIFAQFCLGCHNDKKVSGGLSLEPYKDA